MKIVSRKGKRVYMREMKPKLPSRFVRHFRSYSNLSRYGLSKAHYKTSRNKLKLRGAGPMAKESGFVTQNDEEWVRKLSNPYDKKIANESLKTLKGLRSLVGIVDPDLNGKPMDQLLKEFNSRKSEIIQEALGNRGHSGEQIRKRIERSFKDIGLTLIGKGWLWDTGNDLFESTGEKKQQFTAALDDLISQARIKSQTAFQTLQQLYLKQGDREEGEQIREDERKKQKEQHDKDREESLPGYQSVDEVNPLGFVTKRRTVRVDPNNSRQIQNVRQNPLIREFDRSYLSANTQRQQQRAMQQSTNRFNRNVRPQNIADNQSPQDALQQDVARRSMTGSGSRW